MDELDNFTAQQKVNMLFSGGGISTEDAKNDSEIHQKRGQRKRITKERIVSRFEKSHDFDMQKFEKDALNWIEVFSSESQDPEAITPTDTQSDMNSLQLQKGGGQGKYPRSGLQQWRGAPGAVRMGALEEEENEEDPEWVDFDPKKESSAFFGRAIQNESELRDAAKKEKELQIQRGYKKANDDDEFEQVIREEQERARKRAQNDMELSKKLDNLANDLEISERNYSDIDLIYEKKSKSKTEKFQIDDSQLEDLFTSIMEEEEKKKTTKTVSKIVKNTQKEPEKAQIPQVQLSQNLQQQIKDLTIQQKQQLQQQKIVAQQKPQFTALQNVQNLFINLPVVSHEKHRIKMDEIVTMKPEENKGDLFKLLMASINPFAKFMIEEETNDNSKPWMLEPSIFSKPSDQIHEDNLKKSSSEMFVIYKYFSDPLIQVKSQQYTGDQYIQIKDLFPQQNLLQTSPLNVQLQTYQQLGNYPQRGGDYAKYGSSSQSMQTNASVFVPSKKQQQQPQLSQDQQQTTVPQIQNQSQQNPSELSKVQIGKSSTLGQPQPDQQQIGGMPELSDMESQLKNLLGFNPR